jgi:ActR/RegA family two-component response regulator/GAF domain-containing protein
MSKDVLVVDDDAAFRKSFIRLFRKRDYRFFEAASASEAIEKLEANHQIRVVILDLALGSGSGTEVLEHIHPRSDDYRVIVLTAHQRLLGSKRARHFDIFTYLVKADYAAESLRFSVEQAFVDLERAELHDKLRRLLEIEKKINAHSPLHKTLDLICHSLLATIGGYTCHIRLYDFSRGDYHTVGYAGAEAQRSIFGQPRARGALFSGRIVETGHMEVFEDVWSDPAFREFAERALDERRLTEAERKYWNGIASALLLPISTGIFGRHVDAVLNVSSEGKGFFTEEKQHVAAEFTAQAAFAITRDWLQQKQQDLHTDYSNLAQMLSAISGKRHTRDVLHSTFQTVTERISDILNAEVVSIFLYDNSTERLELCAERRGGEVVTDLVEGYVPGQSLTGQVYLANEVLHLPEGPTKAYEDPRFDSGNLERYLKSIPSGRVDHYLGVPIRIDGKPRGVLRAINKRSALYDAKTAAGNPFALLERGFDLHCRYATEIAAAHLAVAIQSAELSEEKVSAQNQAEEVAGSPRPTARVFLCHAHADATVVRRIYSKLRKRGFLPWIDEKSLRGGNQWELEIEKAIEEADYFVFFVSRNSVGREGTMRREVKLALRKQDGKLDGATFFIPARLERCPRDPSLLRFQHVDLFEKNGFTALVSALSS